MGIDDQLMEAALTEIGKRPWANERQVVLRRLNVFGLQLRAVRREIERHPNWREPNRLDI